MRRIWVAGIGLAFAVTAFGQNPPDNPQSTAQQNGGTTPQVSPREAKINEATLDMIHKDYVAAAEVYKALLKETPNDAGMWNRLGIAYHQEALLGDALKCYERAAKVDKKNGDALNNIGTIYFQQRKWAKAIRSYKKAVALDAQIATYYSNMGVAYLNSNHVPEALESFNAALRLDPDVFTHSGRIGTILQDRSVSDQGKFYFLLAKTFAASGNAERCGFYLKRSRDEGYKGLESAKSDPAFTRVLTDPIVREVLGLPALSPPPTSRGE